MESPAIMIVLVFSLCEKADLYLQALKVNPGNALLVVRQIILKILSCLILSVRSLLPVEHLVGECEKRYVVERMDGKLLEKVLTLENEYRRQLTDQVVTSAFPEAIA